MPVHMLWACRKCKLMCRQVNGPMGEKVWVHGRAWETHDHEPDPVNVPANQAILSCDYCGDLGARWMHEGQNVVMLFPDAGMDYPYGPRWTACGPCDELAKRGDVDGLLERHFNSDATPATYKGTNMETAREVQRAALAEYLPSIHRRSLIPPPPPPPTELSPSRLPKVRDRLVTLWQSELWRNIVSAPKPDGDPILLPGADFGDDDAVQFETIEAPKDVIERFCERIATGLAVGDIYWVSPEFTMLAVNAGKKLPDLTITPEEMPSTSGVIVYAQPIFEQEAPGVGAQEAVAVSWVRIPQGIWLTAYLRPEKVLTRADPAWIHREVGYLMPFAPGAGLSFGTHPVDGVSSRPAGTAWATLLSTWFLMAQPGVATVTEQQPERKERQRASRAGRTAPVVRIVDLRRQKARAVTGDSEPGTGFHYSVRFLVGGDTGGFWRDQAYGPQRARRKRIWIEPFIKGPEGAPLKADKPPVVKVLR
jgi:hypothetical protein